MPSGKRYIRYVYPYFGTTAPHSTSVVHFIAGDSTPLPPTACEYSFAADTDSVVQQFVRCNGRVWEKVFVNKVRKTFDEEHNSIVYESHDYYY